MSHICEPGSFWPRLPFHMVWLATNACDAHCRHCSSNSGLKRSDELGTKEVFDLLNQLSDSGVVDLAISGGEPLLRDDILDIIHYAVSLKYSVGIGSNGGNLSEEKIELVSRIGINRLQISLDGFAQTHDRLRNWTGLFDIAVATTKKAIEMGIRTHICFTINRLNVSEIEEFTSFILGLGVKRLNFSRYVPTGRGNGQLDLSIADWQYVIQLCNDLRIYYKGKLEITNHLSHQIFFDDEVASMAGFIGCQAGVGQGCITASGEVWPCVLLPVRLGNIREQSFKDIWWNSDVIKALHCRENLEGACGICAAKYRCGGCRAAAFAKSGNYLAEDPRCWL